MDNEQKHLPQKNGALLFTTPTCPNCPTAKAHLDKAGFKYTVIDATKETALADKYGIQSVPTLVDGENIYRGVGEILSSIRNRA